MTTRWKFILSLMVVSFFFGVVNLALGGGGAVVKIALVAVGLSLIWSNQHHRLIKAIVSVAVAVALWSFLSQWGPTKDFTKWLSTRGAIHSPRNNFNTTGDKNGKPIAEAGVVICDGKVTRRTPLSYRFDPDTGCPVVPMTPFYAQELMKLEGAPLAAPVNNTCTYCLGQGCETTHPATITGPGQMQIRSERYGTTADFWWKLNGEGTWKQDFPKSGGTLRWADANYKKGLLRGSVTDTANTPGGTWIVVLTCNGEIPIPNS